MYLFLENLQYLRLGDNNLHSIPSESLRRLHRLRHLDLKANNISHIAEDAFTGFGDSITFLNLQKNEWDLPNLIYQLLSIKNWKYLTVYVFCFVFFFAHLPTASKLYRWWLLKIWTRWKYWTCKTINWRECRKKRSRLSLTLPPSLTLWVSMGYNANYVLDTRIRFVWFQQFSMVFSYLANHSKNNSARNYYYTSD